MAREFGRSGEQRSPGELQIGRDGRLLVVAAHPDDDVLAAGGLLQRAVAAGAAVDVVFVTDGENNPWAQRASERIFLVRAADRPRFGARRRGEALAALARLGVGAGSVRFLGIPDQGMTRLLVERAAATLGMLREVLAAARPTVLVGPSAADLHPDHSALAVLLRLALAAAPVEPPPLELACMVHNPALRHCAPVAFRLHLEPPERERKHAAILCHGTQLHLRGPWLRSFASATEEFVPVPWPAQAPHPALAVRTSPAGHLAVTIATHPRLRSFGARELLVLADGGDGDPRTHSCPLPAVSRRVPVTDAANGASTGRGTFAGGALGGELTLPASLVTGARRVFLKLERRFGFFDEAGWLEVSRREYECEA